MSQISPHHWMMIVRYQFVCYRTLQMINRWEHCGRSVVHPLQAHDAKQDCQIHLEGQDYEVEYPPGGQVEGGDSRRAVQTGSDKTVDLGDSTHPQQGFHQLVFGRNVGCVGQQSPC